MRWIRFLLFLPASGSTFADSIDLLHFLVIGCTLLGATGVAAVTLWYMMRYRRRSNTAPTPEVKASKAGEAFIIGSILMLFLLFWVVGFSQYVKMSEAPAGAMEVYVTGKQWMWKFSYPGGRRSINVLTVPVGRPVKLVMTSRDVIHSFFVPAFRIKQDVIPGRYVSQWFEATQPGTYEVFCAEYCGVSHSRMLAAVVVLSQPDYDDWLARGENNTELSVADFESVGGMGEPSGSNLVELGRTVAARRQCFACHTIDGQRHVGPTWRGLYGSTIPLQGGKAVVADEAYLTRSMMDPMAEVHEGFQPVMPTYQGVLQAPEAAAIVEYIKALREGEAEPSVQLPTISSVESSDAAAAPSPTQVGGIELGDGGVAQGDAEIDAAPAHQEVGD